MCNFFTTQKVPQNWNVKKFLKSKAEQDLGNIKDEHRTKDEVAVQRLDLNKLHKRELGVAIARSNVLF